MKKTDKILITGTNGFIGKHLCQRLTNDEGIKNLVKFDIGCRPLEDIKIIKELRKRFEVFKPKIVIHLAALTGVRDSIEYPKEYFETNVIGTYNILKVSQEFEVKKFLFASSSSVYGNQKCPLSEDMKTDRQLSPYAISKKMGEILCKCFDSVPTIAFRPFTVYGENGRENMVVRKLMRSAKLGTIFYEYGNGDSSRGYTNVHDLCEGIIKLIDYEPKENFEIFNLGGSEQVKLNDLIQMIKEVYPNLKTKRIKKKREDVLHSFADINKARRILNWQPKRKFKEEILKLCNLK